MKNKNERKGMGPIFGVFIILLLFVVGYLFIESSGQNVKRMWDLVEVQQQISHGVNSYNTLYVYPSLVNLDKSVKEALNFLGKRGLIYVPNEYKKEGVYEIFPYAKVLFLNNNQIGVWQKVEQNKEEIEWQFSPPLLQSQTLYPVKDKNIRDKKSIVIEVDKRAKLLVIYSTTHTKAKYEVKGEGCEVKKYNNINIDSTTYYGAYIINVNKEKCKVTVSSSIPIYSFYYLVYSFIPSENRQAYQLDSLSMSTSNSNIKEVIERLKALGIEKKEQIYALKNKIEKVKQEDIEKLNKLKDIEFVKHFQAYNVVEQIGKEKSKKLASISSSLNIDERLVLSDIIDNIKGDTPSISISDIEKGKTKEKIREYVENLKNKNIISANSVVDIDKLTRDVEQLYNMNVLTKMDKDEIIGMFIDTSSLNYVKDIIENKGGIVDQIKDIENSINDIFSFDLNIKDQIDECLIYNSLSQMQQEIINKEIGDIKNVEEVKQLLSRYAELKEYYENPTSKLITEIEKKTGISASLLRKYYNVIAKYNIKDKASINEVLSKITNSKDASLLKEVASSLPDNDINEMWRDAVKKIGAEGFECSKANLDLSSLFSLPSSPLPSTSSSSTSPTSSSLLLTLSKLDYIEKSKKKHNCNYPSLSLSDILKDIKDNTNALKEVGAYLNVHEDSVIKNSLDNMGYFLSTETTKDLYAPYNIFIPRTKNNKEVKVVGIRDDVKVSVDTKTKKNAFLLTFHPFIQTDINSNFWLVYDLSERLGEHITNVIIPLLKDKVKDIEDHFYATTYSCLPKCTYLPDPVLVKKKDYDERLNDVLKEVEEKINKKYSKHGLEIELKNIEVAGVFKDERYAKNKQETSSCVCNPTTIPSPTSIPHLALKCITHYDHRVIYIPTILISVKYKDSEIKYAIQLPLDDNVCDASSSPHTCSDKEIKEQEIKKESIDDIDLEELLNENSQKKSK